MILEKVKLNIVFWGFEVINEVKFLYVGENRYMIKFNLGCLFFVEYFVCVCINNFINLNNKIFFGIIFISI